MRALLTSAALAVSLAACATRPATVAMAPQPDVDVPLAARLFPPQYGQLAVGLNKPAFVAIFEVVPGRGASLVYPTGGTGFTSMREAWIPLRYNPQRWLYTSDSRYGTFSYAGLNSGWANAYPTNGGARYFFMVASEDPIAVEQFQDGANSVRRFLGVNYDSFRPYEVMEELAYALLPYAADERWITDVVVDWGYDWGYGYGPMAAYSNARWEPVACADGSIRMARYVVGWGYDNLPCALRGYAQPPVLPIDPNQPGTPGDSVDGRERAPAPNDEPRTRQRTGATATADQDMSDEEVRRRITQLREDALRTRFSRQLDEELRGSVTARRRIANLAGRTDFGNETVRSSPSRAADEAYRRAEASRPRERSARPGQPTRTTAGAPRGRSGDGASARPSGSGSSGRAVRSGSGSSGGSSERSRAGGSTSSGGSASGSGSARPSSSSGSSGSGTPSKPSSTGSGRSRIPPA